MTIKDQEFAGREPVFAEPVGLGPIFESSEDAVCAKSLDGVVTAWNASSERMFGFTAAEVVGTRFSVPSPADQPDEVPPAVAAVLRGERVLPFETRRLHKDGHPIHISVSISAIRGSGGLVMGFALIARDTTERWRAEEALEKAHRELQEAVETKDRFLATLSHELRTPLTPVLAVISRLTADPRLAPFAGDFAMIQRNVELEARLIDDLLDLTRIARGKLELHRQDIDARRVIEHALATAERDFSAGGLRLDVRLAPEEHRLWADAPRLTQVFWNLLSNAVKFTPEGGTITIESRFDGSPGGSRELVVAVRDTGIGIDPEVLPRIFEAFEQTDRRITRRFGGLGLGLAVSRAIVDLHGGRLTAESEGEGMGALFTVRLPIATVRGGDLDETGVWFSRQRPPTELPSAEGERPLHILLVEDHEDTAEAMAALLRLMGHEVTAANSVAAAMAAAGTAQDGASRPLDLVVSDLGLPDGSGQDVMRELSRRYGLKGIALSGYGMDEDVRRSQEAGFLRHLTKPVDLQMLKAAIRQVAGS